MDDEMLLSYRPIALPLLSDCSPFLVDAGFELVYTGSGRRSTKDHDLLRSMIVRLMFNNQPYVADRGHGKLGFPNIDIRDVSIWVEIVVDSLVSREIGNFLSGTSRTCLTARISRRSTRKHSRSNTQHRSMMLTTPNPHILETSTGQPNSPSRLAIVLVSETCFRISTFARIS